MPTDAREGALSYAIGYAERRAAGGQIAASDVLAGLAELGWTVMVVDPFAVKAIRAALFTAADYLPKFPVAADPAGGEAEPT